MATIAHWEDRVRYLTNQTAVTGSNLREAERKARANPHDKSLQATLVDLKRDHHRSLTELDNAERELKAAKAAAK
jgi:hypothetical protein